MQNRLLKLYTEYLAEGHGHRIISNTLDLRSSWPIGLIRSVNVNIKSDFLKSQPHSWQIGSSNGLGLKGEVVDRVRLHFEDCSFQRKKLNSVVPVPQHSLRASILMRRGSNEKPTRHEESKRGDGVDSRRTSCGCNCNHVHDPHLFDELDSIVFALLAERHFDSFSHSPQGLECYQHLLLQYRPLSALDFPYLRVLGKGGFGLVTACRKADTGRLFAAKAMSKKRLKQRKAEDLALQERVVLARVDSPFIVCLRYAYQTPLEVVLVLDLMTGGDLRFHLNQVQREGPIPLGEVGFSVEEVRFYTARIVLALAALHDLGIVYRDLKPENILLDSEGYSKLSDLGLACSVDADGTCGGLAGTRGYWAPEMARRGSDGRRGRYSLSADWFSLGCVVLELLTGRGPLRRDQESGDDGMLLSEQPLDVSAVSDSLSRDFVKELLNKDPSQRLGAAGWQEVAAHPWFGASPAAGSPLSLAEQLLRTIAAGSPPRRPSKQAVNAASQEHIEESGVGIAEEREKLADFKMVLTEEDQQRYRDWPFFGQRAYQAEVVELLRKNGEGGGEQVHDSCSHDSIDG